MAEFFGFGDVERTASGAYSWQHLTFVSTLMLIMVGLAVFFGLKNRGADERKKNLTLIVAAILIDAFEIFKIVIFCARAHDPMGWLSELPLYLCSIQLITIPLAAFSRGRVKDAALDFVFIFGILGAVLGTYGAAQNYGVYPVLGVENVVSGITHSISGFVSLYIVISGMASMKKRNIPITFGILGFFAAAALAVDLTLGYNYMFLMQGDGTPYDIFYNMVGGNPIAYPIIVIALFLIYITLFYLIYFYCGYVKRTRSLGIKELVARLRKKPSQKSAKPRENSDGAESAERETAEV